MAVVVLVSGDLMGASRIEGAARLAGLNLRMFGNAVSAVECCAAERVPLVMIDLTLAGLDVDTLVSQLKLLPNAAPIIIAYGPHVHEAKLAAALAAGCDKVLSRGQFLSSVDAIIAHHTAN